MILRGVAVVVPAQILKLAVSLSLQIVIARLLLPEGRGLYGICIAISTPLLIITYLGNEFGIRYLLAHDLITPAQALRYLTITACLSWSIAIALSFVVTRGTDWLPEDVTFSLLCLASTFSFLQLISTQINVFMTLKGQFKGAAVLSISDELLKLALVSIFIWSDPSVNNVLVASVVSCAITALISMKVGNLLKIDYDSLSWKDLRMIYSYGSRSVWLNLSSLSNAHIGTLVLSGLLSNAQIGIYNLAFSLVARLQVIPDAINRVLVPATIKAQGHEARFTVLQFSIAGLSCVCLILLPVVAMLNGPAIELMFGQQYSSVGLVVFILFIGFSFKVICKPIEAHFIEISGNPVALGKVQFLSLILMTGLTYIGACRFGLLGASIGSSLALLLSSLALFVIYGRAAGRRVSSLFSFRPLARRIYGILRKST